MPSGAQMLAECDTSEKEAWIMTKVKAQGRSSESLRDTLFETLDGLRSKALTPQEAMAVCKVTAQIINSVNTEIEFYKHIGRHHQPGETPRMVLQLGSS